MIWRKRAFGQHTITLGVHGFVMASTGDKARVRDCRGQLGDRPALVSTEQDPHSALAMCFGLC